MAEDCVRTTGEDRCDPAALERQAAVANGVDAAEDAVQPAGDHAVVDRVPPVAESLQLPVRNDRMLQLGELCDPQVTWTTLIPHRRLSVVHV
jgi:hypothetical protein